MINEAGIVQLCPTCVPRPHAAQSKVLCRPV